MRETERFRKKKALGQHFLSNAGIAEKMIEKSGITADYGVLEIGPGQGALTAPLLRRAGKVVAVELDKALAPMLRERFAGDDHFILTEADILQADIAGILSEHFPDRKKAVIGNLPYYITTPILMRLLEERLPIEHITVMVQKEAAKRFVAPEGSRESGAVTLAMRYYSEPALLFTVSRGSFSPPPKVDSAVVRFTIRPHPVIPKEPSLMFRVIKQAFSARRKTIQNALKPLIAAEKIGMDALFERTGIDPMARAERLTLADYAALADCLSAQEMTD